MSASGVMDATRMVDERDGRDEKAKVWLAWADAPSVHLKCGRVRDIGEDVDCVRVWSEILRC